MHKHLTIEFNKLLDFTLPIIKINNSLDYVKFEIITPNQKHVNSLELNRIKMNQNTLNNSLQVYKKDLRSLFLFDYLLSKSGKALNMLIFLQLKFDCPMCYACKINGSLLSLAGATRTKILCA